MENIQCFAIGSILSFVKMYLNKIINLDEHFFVFDAPYHVDYYLFVIHLQPPFDFYNRYLMTIFYKIFPENERGVSKLTCFPLKLVKCYSISS